MNLAAWIKQHTSVAAFAKAIEAPQTSVYYWISGERIPRPAAMKRIVAATGGAVQASDFYETDGVHGDGHSPITGNTHQHETVNAGGFIPQTGEAAA